MENIGNFLTQCEAYGLTKQDLFQTVDLYEGQNMPQVISNLPPLTKLTNGLILKVINGLHALGRKAQTKGKPGIGPKEATQNKREFSEEQLAEGKGIIGLQMGSNKGASQAGATPYGLGRQIEKTNLKV